MNAGFERFCCGKLAHLLNIFDNHGETGSSLMR